MTRQRRLWWLYPLLAGLGIMALTGLIGLGVLLFNRTPPNTTYHPDEVEYNQPIEVVHDMRSGDSYPTVLLSTEGPLPALELSDDFYNLGRISAQNSRQDKHTFVLRNTGDGELVVHRIYSTCTYVTADLTASIIPPGKVALLMVSMDLQGQTELVGMSVRRGIIIESNDPVQPESEIWVQAVIVP